MTLQAPFSGNYCGWYFLKPRNLKKRKAWDSGKRGIQNKSMARGSTKMMVKRSSKTKAM